MISSSTTVTLFALAFKASNCVRAPFYWHIPAIQRCSWGGDCIYVALCYIIPFCHSVTKYLKISMIIPYLTH